MTPWVAILCLAATAVLAAALVMVGYWLGQAQSSSALHAAEALSSMINETSDRLFQVTKVESRLDEMTATFSLLIQQHQESLTRVQGMDETLGNLVEAMVRRGMVRQKIAPRMVGDPKDPAEPPPLDRSAIPEV